MSQRLFWLSSPNVSPHHDFYFFHGLQAWFRMLLKSERVNLNFYLFSPDPFLALCRSASRVRCREPVEGSSLPFSSPFLRCCCFLEFPLLGSLLLTSPANLHFSLLVFPLFLSHAMLGSQLRRCTPAYDIGMALAVFSQSNNLD